MADNTDFLRDPRLWLSAVALLVSGCSAFMSWRSLRNSSRAAVLGELQEKRRQPQFNVYEVNNFRRLLRNRQLFGFLISVSNPSDINNSIARAELQITSVME